MIRKGLASDSRIGPAFLFACVCFVFCFYHTATREFYTCDYTLSLHDALPILRALLYEIASDELGHIGLRRNYLGPLGCRDRKSTRLNSSHSLTSRMPSSA